MSIPASSRSKRIADHAMIGDGETAALVHRDGSIVWLCWPRFDSEACFAALVGDDHHGRWRLAAEDPASVSRRYEPDTLVLETMIETETGAARVLDFMPMRGDASVLARIVIGERGSVRMRSDLALLFDFGRRRPLWDRESDRQATAVAGQHGARLTSDAPITLGEDGTCVSAFTIEAGQTRAFSLTYFVSHGSRPGPVDVARALEETRGFWRDWIGRCAYDGPWREAVVRSLITLKALIYRPSGAIAAAPTSSLPEKLGGQRNWDYRFCWLRDATFSLLALLGAGYEDEARAWRDWLLRAIGGEPEHLQPAYGLGGETRLTEWRADWLPGFNGAAPVRIGNIAYRQLQLDLQGEVIDALHQGHLHGLALDDAAWRAQVRMVEHLERVWREPDRGIWETRGDPRRFTHSQAMIWAALDRTIIRGEAAGFAAPYTRWRALRARVREVICRRAFNPDLNSFTRAFDSDELDASVLLLPQIGFLPADDPRILGTIAAIGARLNKDGYILRYDTQASEDGKPGDEAAFLACNFWYADALILGGQRDQAQAVFERILAVRNDVGLLSEEFDPEVGALTGNFPQALSHLALINTALNLGDGPAPARRRSQAAG